MELTEAAIRQVKKSMDTDSDAIAIRIAIKSGGCSGFQYDFSFASEIAEGDVLTSHDGAAVVMDAADYEVLKECTLDYVNDLMSAKFTVYNPKAAGCCGCGESFS